MRHPLESLLRETQLVFRTLNEVANEPCVAAGIGSDQRAILELLAREGRPLSLAALARLRLVPRRQIQIALERLPQPDWVVRTPDPLDAQSDLLSLGRAGRAYCDGARAADHDFLHGLQIRLDPEDVRATAATLRKLRRMLQRLPGANHTVLPA